MNMPMFAKKMFHRIHLIEGTDGDYVEEETEIPESPTADLLDMANTATPGLVILEREKQENTKRLPKAVKFNKSFDIAKVLAEVMSMMPQKMFETHFKAAKNFLGLMKGGLTYEHMEYLSNPDKFDFIPKVVVPELNC